MAEFLDFDTDATTEDPQVSGFAAEPELELTGSTSFFDVVDKLREPEQKLKSSKAIASKFDNGVLQTYLKHPTPKNGAKILPQLMPYITSAVYSHTKSSSPVLIGQGRILAMKALPKYDGRASIQTFLHSQLQPLKRQAAVQSVGVKISRSIPQDKRRLATAFEQLTDSLGREPSFAELSDVSGLSLKRIHVLNKVNLPILAETESAGDEDSIMTAGDMAVQDNAQIWEKTVYHGLDPVNQYIMQHTTGIYGAKVMRNDEIAKKLKLSPAAVSYRKTQIEKMLGDR